MNYPTKIADEFATMRAVAAGASLARFGDGELKLMCGKAYRREPANQALAAELRQTLNSPCNGLLIGIPTMNRRGPKFENWDRHRERFETVIERSGPFYSAFVTRPDSAPWIETAEYMKLVQSVWAGRRVTLLSEPSNKLVTIVPRAARSVEFLECPSACAYARIAEFERLVIASRPDVAILSCGVTATCLAHRLARAGVHTLDFGSVGGMLARLSAPPA